MKLTAKIKLNENNPQAIPTGHRSTIRNCGNTAHCKIQLLGRMRLKPGETSDAELIITLEEKKNLGKVAPQSEIFIMNGMREVGIAKILRVSA